MGLVRRTLVRRAGGCLAFGHYDPMDTENILTCLEDMIVDK
jgi:hypothetical protein